MGLEKFLGNYEQKDHVSQAVFSRPVKYLPPKSLDASFSRFVYFQYLLSQFLVSRSNVVIAYNLY